MVKMKKILSLFLLIAMMAGIFTGCATNDNNSFQSMEDFRKAKIGVLTGSSQELIVKEKFPKAKRVYFSSPVDMVIAVEQGKIDGYMFGSPFLVATTWENAKVKRLDEAVDHGEIAFAFPQDPASDALREQLNDFIKQAKEDGTMDRLTEKWLGETEPTEHPDYQSLTGENGTIRLAAVAGNKPLIYQHQEQCTGYEMELLTLFAEAYGYRYDVDVVPFESVILGMAAGKYDMTSASLQITPEREQSVNFSDPYMQFDVVIVVKDGKAGAAAEVGQSKKTLSDFENATIGILSGSSFDPLAKKRFPDAERKYYSIVADMILAVEQGKIDAYMSETTYLTAALWEGANLNAVEEVIDRTNAGYIFQKDGTTKVVKEQLDDFIRKARESGMLDELLNKWLSSAEPSEIYDSSRLTGENGTLKVAIASDLKPLGYIKGGKIVGYEVEVLQHFAEEYGYQLEFVDMTFDAILPGVVSGKYDIGAGGMTITEERAQSVDFSESYITVDVVMVVAAEENSVAQTGFWDDTKESFEKTFIREDRWKLIVEGIGVTMLISLCAVIAGTLLGFGLYMLSRSDVKLLQTLAKGFAKVYSRIVAGTPVVVILMILFYVVFGKIRDMSGILVAILWRLCL